MFVRLTRGHFGVDQYDAVLKVLQEQVIPDARQRPGFRGVQLGIDRANGRFMFARLVDTAGQAEALPNMRTPCEEAGVQFEPTEVYEIITEG